MVAFVNKKRKTLETLLFFPYHRHSWAKGHHNSGDNLNLTSSKTNTISDSASKLKHIKLTLLHIYLIYQIINIFINGHNRNVLVLKIIYFVCHCHHLLKFPFHILIIVFKMYSLVLCYASVNLLIFQVDIETRQLQSEQRRMSCVFWWQ